MSPVCAISGPQASNLHGYPSLHVMQSAATVLAVKALVLAITGIGKFSFLLTSYLDCISALEVGHSHTEATLCAHFQVFGLCCCWPKASALTFITSPADRCACVGGQSCCIGHQKQWQGNKESGTFMCLMHNRHTACLSQF